MSDNDDDGFDADKSNQFLASMSSLEGGRRRFLHGTDESQVLVIFPQCGVFTNLQQGILKGEVSLYH